MLKFRGAGQGPLALVAELVAGEIGRALGLKVPELVFVEVDSALGRNEPDQEIRDLLRASVGLNLALDYLPGSVMFDPAAGDKAADELASDGSLVRCVRHQRRPHGAQSQPAVLAQALHFIDHGAALYFHHNWQSIEQMAEIALPRHPRSCPAALGEPVEEADRACARASTDAVLTRHPERSAGCVAAKPVSPAGERRAEYLAYFRSGWSGIRFVEEAIRARAQLV